MSMICHLVAVDRKRLDELIRQPDQLFNMIFPDDGVRREPHLDLDKAWHGLHYLLTGDPWEGEPPLSLAMLGGTPIGKDTGYGPRRYLTPEEVAQVAAALDETTPEQLAARYVPGAMDEAGVYPHGWSADRDDGLRLQWLLERFDDLAGFYGEATARGMAVILCLS